MTPHKLSYKVQVREKKESLLFSYDTFDTRLHFLLLTEVVKFISYLLHDLLCSSISSGTVISSFWRNVEQEMACIGNLTQAATF